MLPKEDLMGRRDRGGDHNLGKENPSIAPTLLESGPSNDVSASKASAISKPPSGRNYSRTSKFMMGPMIGILVGAAIGTHLTISDKTVSGLKSLAAGIVLAAVSTELVPEIAEVKVPKERLWVLFGIVMGAMLLIVMRTYFSKYDPLKSGGGRVPWEMVLSIAIDFFVDAILIGMAMTITTGVEGNTGMVMAVALGTEMLIITLTASGQMKENSVKTPEIWSIAIGLSCVVLLGGLLGNYVAKSFKGSPPYYGLLAFGVAALIWLIIEELLVETSKNNLDSRIQASLVFIGFLGVISSGWMGSAN